MISRTFEYTGYNGQPQHDTWWFNLTEAELYKLELGSAGGMAAKMRRLLREEKTDELVDFFEKLILGSVGERSTDGRKFIKNEEIRQDFYQSKAYSDLFVELVSSGEALTTFMKGVVPENVAAAITEAEKAQANGEAAALPEGQAAVADAVH